MHGNKKKHDKMAGPIIWPIYKLTTTQVAQMTGHDLFTC